MAAGRTVFHAFLMGPVRERRSREPKLGDVDWRRRAALRIDEVATLLGLSCQTVRRLIQRGELPAVRMGGRTFVSSQALRERLGEIRNNPKAAAQSPSAIPRALKVRAAAILDALDRSSGGRGS